MGQSVPLVLIVILLAYLVGGLTIWGVTRRSLRQSGANRSTLARLTNSLRRLESVLDSTDSGILVYDSSQVVLFANHLLGRWFAVDSEAAIGQPLADVLRADIVPKLVDGGRLLARLERVHDHPDAVNEEEYEQFWPVHRFLRIFSGPVRDDGEVIGRIVVLTDLTERRRQEAERDALGRIARALVHEPTLAAAATTIVEETANLLGASGAGLWVVRPDRAAVYLIAERGLTPRDAAEIQQFDLGFLDALWSRHQYDVVASSVAAPEDNPLRRLTVARGFTSFWGQPLKIHDRFVGLLALGRTGPVTWTEGERRLIDAIADLAAAAIDAAVAYDEAVVRARDAEAARTSLQQFLGMVSHDLRGPVSVALGYSQLLISRGDLSPDHEKVVRSIEDAARQMGRLIDDLLTAARIGSGRFEIQPARTDLVEVASQAIAQIRAAAPDRAFLLEAPDTLVGIWDAARLGQLLSNLLSNAVKYSPSGRPVKVTLQAVGREAVIGVTDEGVGMTPEQVARLFQPFTRLNHAPVSGGSGLGLYIAKGIVETHGGKIWVESQPGVGSTFWVSLPREAQNG